MSYGVKTNQIAQNGREYSSQRRRTLTVAALPLHYFALIIALSRELIDEIIQRGLNDKTSSRSSGVVEPNVIPPDAALQAARD